ncbi:hypothetical protein MCOR25_003846 [Pyricularia grisea]|uniref:Uncharacterized protein n=1 Tax=Pyricularia grisea TaxID=148305 RepID=A0A6P8BKE5_PYRGI|nr:uncharacterized protein PgNI_00524 [Pyricularia grisea]KAI6372111.1 hypothetical protein MCOR25_003846 [Pyricularia grisea]TLD17130.1 hypothetical protein PgNI_00524 [Pyricularia grisea]
MQFTTSVLSLIALAVSVNAHGHSISPLAMANTTPFQNIRIPANGCGEGVDVSKGTVAATYKAGSTGTVIWDMVNGDGGGPLSVAFDASGKGTSFTKAKIITNIEGSNGGVSNSVKRGNKTLTFTVPSTTCARCVMQIRQDITGKDGFGSCAIVTIS